MQATEIDPEAPFYNHQPRAAYLWFLIRTFAELDGERALDENTILRVLEHAPVPRLYVVESGRVRIRAGRTWRVRIEAALIDPLDGARIRIDSEFDAEEPARS